MLVPSANDAAEALALHVGQRICRSFRRADERESRRARPLGHALRESARARRAGPRLERAGCDSARPLRARRPVHPRRALALERLASRRKDVRVDRRSPRRPGRRSSAERRATRDDAGWSQTAAAQRGGATVYGAVLGSDTRSSRNDALRELLTYGLDQYRARPADRPSRVYATGRRPATASPTSSSSRRARSCARSGSGVRWSSASSRRPSLALPVAKGQRLGRVEVYEGNRLVASSNLVAAAAVADAGVWAKAKWYATQTARNLWEMLT